MTERFFCFHFVGRARTISDLVGEKLNETWLVNLIMEDWPGIYLCLIPDLKSSGYRLFSSAAIDVKSFESKLMSSPHYCNARLLNQLSPLKAWVVPDLAQQIKHFFCVQRKMKWGDIKEQWLYSRETDGVLSEFLIKVSTTSWDV